jgi:hypothetical protein
LILRKGIIQLRLFSETGKRILRSGLGYFFQNLAILINIERWTIILTGGSTASIKANSFSSKNKGPTGNEDE